jgi:hypothetical protein
MAKRKIQRLPRIPYFYVIQYIPPAEAFAIGDDELTKMQKYSGIQYSRNCNPANLLKPGPGGYLTSSVLVKRRIKLFGVSCFSILEIITDFGGLTAYEFEEQYQTEHNCGASDEWLNQRNGNGKFITTSYSVVNLKKSRNKFKEVCPHCNELVTNKSAYTLAHGDKCKALPTHPKYKQYVERQQLQQQYKDYYINGKYECVYCGTRHVALIPFINHRKKCIEDPSNENYCKKEPDGKFHCVKCGLHVSKQYYTTKHGIHCTNRKFNNTPQRKVLRVERLVRRNTHNQTLSYLLNDNGNFQCDCGYETNISTRIYRHINSCIGYKDHPNHMEVVGEYFKCPICDSLGKSTRTMNLHHGINCKPRTPTYRLFCICGAKFNNPEQYEQHVQNCIHYPTHPNHKLPNQDGLYECDKCWTKTILEYYRRKHGIHCNHLSTRDTLAKKERTELKMLVDSYSHLVNADGVLECECGFMYPKSLKRFRIHREQCVRNTSHPNHKTPNEYGYYECDHCGMWILSNNIYRNKHGINCKPTTKPYAYGVARIKRELGIA